MKTFISLSLISYVIGMLAPVSASAGEVTLNTDLRFRSFYSNNLTDAHRHRKDICPGSDGTLDQTCDDQESFHDIRFRVKTTAEQGVGSGVVTVDLFSREGRDVATLNTGSGSAETGYWRLGDGGFGGGLTTIVLREAYLRITLPAVTAQAGRQSIHFGHGLLLDDTADGIVVAIPAGPVGISFGGVKLVESEDVAATNTDTDLYFTHFSWTPGPGIVTTLFATTVQDRGPGLALNGVCQDPSPAPSGLPPAFQRCALSDLGDQHMRLLAGGWTLDITKEQFRIGMEFDVLRGRVKTNEATLLNPEGDKTRLAGLNTLVELEGNLSFVRVGLTGIYASGQDPKKFNKINLNAISPNYELANILINNEMDGDRDGGNVGGMTAIRFGLERAIAGDLEGELAVIWARLTQRPFPGIEPDLGWEVDFNTTYPLDDHLLWRVGLGYLFSGEAWEGIYGDPKADHDQIKAFSKLIFTY